MLFTFFLKIVSSKTFKVINVRRSMISLASAMEFAKLLVELASGIKILVEVYEKVTAHLKRKK